MQELYKNAATSSNGGNNSSIDQYSHHSNKGNKKGFGGKKDSLPNINDHTHENQTVNIIIDNDSVVRS